MRVIAGKYRGVVLNSFDADNIRPTADRVREGIFNKIQFFVQDAEVLDLFGGTGAISIEFLSRGAKSVTTVDNNKNSVSLINKNFAKIKQSPNLIVSDYDNALKVLKNKKFDIIFIDPPFATNYGENSLSIISELNIIKSDGLIIYEHDKNKKFVVPKDFEIIDEKKYGTIIVSYIKVKND